MRRPGRSLIAAAAAGVGLIGVAMGAALTVTRAQADADAPDPYESEIIVTAPPEYEGAETISMAEVAEVLAAPAPAVEDTPILMAARTAEAVAIAAAPTVRRIETIAAAYEPQLGLVQREQVRQAPRVRASLTVEPEGENRFERWASRIIPTVELGDRPRLFVFAAGDNEAFGFNLLRNREGRTRRAGWSAEKIAELGDAQVGFGLRRGPIQASVALIDRDIDILGVRKEQRFVAFTFSVKPVRAPRPPARIRAVNETQPPFRSQSQTVAAARAGAPRG